MWFDGWDAVKTFAGDTYEQAYVPAAAKQILAHFDNHSQHYEIRAAEIYVPA